MQRAPAIRLVNVGRRYGRRRGWALRNVDLSLESGSVTALVGPNGAGKSTLIRSCLGFERPDEGFVEVHGVNPQADRSRVLRHIGYVPQATSLYPDLTISDHFLMGTIYRVNFDRAYATERVRSVGLEPDRRVGDLSGGEQAQVALAMALGSRADLLLLDEPLASLDPLARRAFLLALRSHLHESTASVVLSSHIVTDIQEVCDSIVVLSDGRVALHSTVEDAVTTHRLAPPDVRDDRLVSTFHNDEGTLVALVRAADRSDLEAATLEHVVLGYLALGARQPLKGAA